MLGVRLPEDLEERMDQYVSKTKMTKSQFVKKAVNAFLRIEELREEHDRLTLQGLKEIEGGQGVPGEVVMRMLDKWSRS
jgi:predicted transcriptional regulator